MTNRVHTMSFNLNTGKITSNEDLTPRKANRLYRSQPVPFVVSENQVNRDRWLAEQEEQTRYTWDQEVWR